jgi:lipoate---protein ligase
MSASSSVFWPASLRCFDLTLPAPAENLALDEALLEAVNTNPLDAQLRMWQPGVEAVVVGRSNRIEMEVHADRCRAEGVPIFRRSSGGGAVVIGPGCLAYTLALPLTDQLRSLGVAAVTRLVMERVAVSLNKIVPGVDVRGTSDLVIENRKFSGNSQRWLRNAFLHHGTILFDFDLSRIGQLLKQPTREPDYRNHRPHAEFVMNLNVRRDELCDQLVRAWNGIPSVCDDATIHRARELSDLRYSRDVWNLER